MSPCPQNWGCRHSLPHLLFSRGFCGSELRSSCTYRLSLEPRSINCLSQLLCSEKTHLPSHRGHESQEGSPSVSPQHPQNFPTFTSRSCSLSPTENSDDPVPIKVAKAPHQHYNNNNSIFFFSHVYLCVVNVYTQLCMWWCDGVCMCGCICRHPRLK